MIKVHSAGWWVRTNVQIATVKSEGRGHASIKHNNSEVSDLLFQVFIFIYPIYAPTKGTHHTRLIKCRHFICPTAAAASSMFFNIIIFIFVEGKSSVGTKAHKWDVCHQCFLLDSSGHRRHIHTTHNKHRKLNLRALAKLTAMEINKFVTRCAKIFAINWKILACKFCSLFKQKVKM